MQEDGFLREGYILQLDITYYQLPSNSLSQLHVQNVVDTK